MPLLKSVQETNFLTHFPKEMSLRFIKDCNCLSVNNVGCISARFELTSINVHLMEGWMKGNEQCQEDTQELPRFAECVTPTQTLQ